MRKYIQSLGYKYVDKDDVRNREFTHFDFNIVDDEDLTVMGKKRFIVTSIFRLFLNHIDVIKLRNQMAELFNELYTQPLVPSDVLFPSENLALSSGETYYLDSYTIEDEKQENGSLLSLIFTIRGD